MTNAARLAPADPRPAPADAASLMRELRFTDADFERVRAMVRRHAGIALAESKSSMVYGRLASRVRSAGCDSFSQWLDRVERTADDETLQDFVNALTTNLTSFFREGYHFPILAERLRELQRAGTRPRIWCAAASTGEEPWTIAMTAVEALGANPQVDILATDIDTNVLQTARRGVYELEQNRRSLGEERLRRFFLRGTGANEGRMRVRPELAKLVTFDRLNLVQPPWRLPSRFDIVFCRNVMIYFDRPTQREVLMRIHEVTEPGALLFAGHSENFTGEAVPFRLRGKTVYERLEAGSR